MKRILKKLKSRLRRKIKVYGNNNDYNRNLFLEYGVKLNIKGNNNKITVGNNCVLKDLVINICGDNNVIKMGNEFQSCDLFINIGIESINSVSNVTLSIGDKTTINNDYMVVLESGSSLKIGKNCMFSEKIEFWASDTHSITDPDGNLLNYGGKIEIGDNVWIGKDVKIGKKAKIPSNSIVGFNSVVTSKFSQSNVILAGNPAKIVKENVNWNRLSPENYLKVRSTEE